MFDVRITGLADLDRVMKTLAPREANNVMRNAIMDVARDGRDEARKNAPRLKGTLIKAIFAQRRRGKRGLFSASIGITRGKDAKNDAFYWHMVEYGTKAHVIPRRNKAGQIRSAKKALSFNGRVYRSVNHPGITAQPFMRPTYEKLKADLNRTYPNHIGKQVIRQIEKVSPKRVR